jgi:LysM repeat protein
MKNKKVLLAIIIPLLVVCVIAFIVLVLIKSNTPVGANIQNFTNNILNLNERARTSTFDYTVKSGDTVNSIASEFGLKPQTILWANNLSVSDKISVNQVLKILPRDGVIVTIKEGDTVESLAKKYSANSSEIIDANWLEAPYALTVGQEFFIPNGTL